MAEELTEEQLAELRAALLDLDRELRAGLLSSGELARPVELDQAAVGRVSRIDAIQQQQMADAAVRRSELRLEQIAVALRAIEDEDYGWCKRCGEPIAVARLRARPESPCCVPCMAHLERG